MDKFFSFFGKFVLIFVIFGVLIGGGYYLGKRNPSLPEAPAAVTTSAPVMTPTLTQSPKQTVKAGVASGLSFSLYTIDVPDTWTIKQVHEDEPSLMDTLTLTHGAYTIKIFQAATGGAMCLYPGDPDVEGPSSRYNTFVPITTRDGTLLRRGNTNGGGYSLCQQGTENYGQPTQYGHISYGVPVPTDESLLKEMDTIIASLKKQ